MVYTKAKHGYHRPWCGDDVCALGWVVIGAQAMVWAKATDHHGEVETSPNVATQAKRIAPKVL